MFYVAFESHLISHICHTSAQSSGAKALENEEQVARKPTTTTSVDLLARTMFLSVMTQAKTTAYTEMPMLIHYLSLDKYT